MPLPSKKPLVSVIVPSRGRADQLAKLLSMLELQHGDGFDFEVIVALDGGVAPESVDRHSYLLRLITLPHVGISAAKNAAVEHSRGGFLLFINDDIEPQPDFIREHVEAHRSGRPFVLGASPWKRFQDQTVFDEMIARTRMIFFYDEMKPGRLYDFRHAWNLNFSVDRAALSQLGRRPFVEAFRPMMYEDVELAFRLCGAEAKICYHPAARAVHDHRYCWENYLKREALLGVMAPVLATVNSECFQAIFGRSLEKLAAEARDALRLDIKDAIRAYEILAALAISPWHENLGVEWLRTAYSAHLPIKRRAFRCGLLAAIANPETQWQERMALANAALCDDPVLGDERLRADVKTPSAARDHRAPRSLPAEAGVAAELAAPA